MSLPDLVSTIREEHRQHCDYHSAEKRLTNQIKALERRWKKWMKDSGDQRSCDDQSLAVSETDEVEEDHVSTDDQHDRVLLNPTSLNLDMARQIIHAQRMMHKKAMIKLGEQLPVWLEWAKDIRGISPFGLAQIVGEAGDLGGYANPAKLWRRMGLAVINGQRQGRRTNAEEALEHGYSPRRRAVMFCLGDSFVKTGGPYRDIYLARKEIEAAKPACKHSLCQAKKNEGRCRPAHIHNRARRWTEKRFLKDLWRAWRRDHERYPETRWSPIV